MCGSASPACNFLYGQLNVVVVVVVVAKEKQNVI